MKIFVDLSIEVNLIIINKIFGLINLGTGFFDFGLFGIKPPLKVTYATIPVSIVKL